MLGFAQLYIQKVLGLFTTGNAIAMAWYRYPRGFKFYRNTASFVPKPGDMAVWGTASFNNGVGHTAVVVGPSNRNYFTSVDQNWRNANGYTGSSGSLENIVITVLVVLLDRHIKLKQNLNPNLNQNQIKPTKPVPSTSPTPDKNTTEQTKPTTKN